MCRTSELELRRLVSVCAGQLTGDEHKGEQKPGCLEEEGGRDLLSFNSLLWLNIQSDSICCDS